MCFYVHSNHIKPKIAKKNMVVYKTFSEHSFIGKSNRRVKRSNAVGFKSYWQNFRYEFGETYFEDSLDKSLYTKEVGLHSYESLEIAFRSAGSQHIKCVIPQGAKYYYNPDDGEYISDYITIGKLSDVISI